MDVREKLVELLAEFYGCDPMYYGVDALAIAQHLTANGVAPVVHGRWEEYLIPNILCCSNCDWGIDPLCKSPYCPNCGAKMDGNWKQTT